MEETVIKTKDLLKKYRGRAAVENLNLNIRKGEIYGFQNFKRSWENYNNPYAAWYNYTDIWKN